jgi:hypothetical protein
MSEIRPPFTPFYGFSGPRTAISCEVEYDMENHVYIARGTGFRGEGHTAEEAALACFQAWVTRHASFYEYPGVRMREALLAHAEEHDFCIVCQCHPSHGHAKDCLFENPDDAEVRNG